MSVWQSWNDNLACKEKHLLSTENITAPQYHNIIVWNIDHELCKCMK